MEENVYWQERENWRRQDSARGKCERTKEKRREGESDGVRSEKCTRRRIRSARCVRARGYGGLGGDRECDITSHLVRGRGDLVSTGLKHPHKSPRVEQYSRQLLHCVCGDSFVQVES